MPRPRASLALAALVFLSSFSLAGCCCSKDEPKKCIKDPPCKPCEQPSCEGYAPKPAK